MKVLVVFLALVVGGIIGLLTGTAVELGPVPCAALGFMASFVSAKVAIWFLYQRDRTEVE